MLFLAIFEPEYALVPKNIVYSCRPGIAFLRLHGSVIVVDKRRDHGLIA